MESQNRETGKKLEKMEYFGFLDFVELRELDTPYGNIVDFLNYLCTGWAC